MVDRVGSATDAQRTGAPDCRIEGATRFRKPTAPDRPRIPLGTPVPEQVDRRADATRSLIVEAASRQFARKSYSEVSLDDIVAHAEVTNGAFYFHFRSKHELALAIIEHQRQAGYLSMTEVLSRKMSALETLVDLTWVIAIRDVEEDATRAGLNLIESIARRR